MKDGKVVVSAPDLYAFDRRLQEMELSHRDIWSKYIGVTKVNYIL